MTTVTAYETTGAFTFDAKENDPSEFAGGNFNKAKWSKVLTGGIQGTSVVHLLMLQQNDGPAAYVGIEHYDVVVAGRQGTFLLLHSATMNGDDHEMTWSIVPGSGTGELTGLAGTAEITPDHDFVLTYTLGD